MLNDLNEMVDTFFNGRPAVRSQDLEGMRKLLGEITRLSRKALRSKNDADARTALRVIERHTKQFG